MTPENVRSLRVRVPLTAMALLAASLAVATVLSYKLLLVAGGKERMRAYFDEFWNDVLGSFKEAAERGGES